MKQKEKTIKPLEAKQENYYGINFEVYGQNGHELIRAIMYLIQSMDVGINEEQYQNMPNDGKRYFKILDK